MKKNLLPPVFKIIGITVIILPIIILVVARASNIVIRNISAQNQELFWQIVRSVCFTGLLFIILAREKVEDEFVDFCRLTAFRLSVLFGLTAIILNPIPLFDLNDLERSSHLLLIQCIFYILIFYATKKGLIRYEK